MAISILTGTPGTPGTDSGGTAAVSFTIPSTVPDGSAIIAIHCNDYRDYTNMVAPTLAGFPGLVPTFLGGVDGGSLLSHIKVWGFAYPAGATGTARALTCTETGSHDGDKGLSVYALSGADTSTFLDGTLVATSSPSVSVGTFVLGAVTTSNTDSLLIAHTRTSNGAGTASIDPPVSMTEQYDVNNFTRFEGATEQLVASGSTGTRTFTPASSVPYVAVMFAIKSAGAAAPTSVFAAPFTGIAPGRLSPSGQFQQPRFVGGQSYSRSLTGSSASSGALTKQDLKALVAASPSSGALAKAASKAPAGSSAPAGALAKVAGKALTGASAAAGTVARAVTKALTAASASSGALAKQASKALTGASTQSGAISLTRVILRSFAGSSTPAGALARAVSKLFGSSSTPAGALSASGGAAAAKADSAASVTAGRTSTAAVGATRTSTDAVTAKRTSSGGVS